VNPQNNRVLVTLLCAGLGIGAVLLFLNLFWWPLQEYNRRIDELEQANSDKQAEVFQILRDKKKLQQWRVLSLPGVENLPKVKGAPPNPVEDRRKALNEADDRYSKYLRDLLKKHDVKYDQIPVGRVGDVKALPQVANNVPVYTPLQFRVDARGRLGNIVRMLEEFQTTPLLHRIRNLTIKRAEKTGAKASPGEPLAVSMLVEALVVNGSQQRGERLFAYAQPPLTVSAALLAARRWPAAGLGLLPWRELYAAAAVPQRRYGDIALKNIFEGAPPYRPPTVEVVVRKTPDLLTKTFLTDVTISTYADPAVPPSMQATVEDRLTERAIKLRKLPGWYTIPLLKCCDGNTVVWGQVVSIDTRGIVFRVRLFARDPAEEPEKLRFKKADAIYRLYKTDVYDLVKANVIREEEALRTYKVPAEYWQTLVKDKVVRERGGEFTFQHDLVRGRVLKSLGDGFVLIRLDPKYCSFRNDDDERVPPHHGYCRLSVAANLTSALQRPLKDSELRELQQTVAQAPEESSRNTLEVGEGDTPPRPGAADGTGQAAPGPRKRGTPLLPARYP
jgi:hypothetical protein